MDEASREEPRPGTPVPRQAEPLQMFEVRITGLVPENLLHELAYVEVVAQELTTSLRGNFRDQAELHGFLATVQALGLDVIEIRRLTGPENPDDSVVER